ncbi:MAG TPA: hypothetical protein CFH84_08295 [Sulfurimonas sp. UBA12504]|nr:MAG: hypothetical protein A2019_00170 [Sulfurimonas sp. GWF2_37_8]DAB29606.1 MAG TPA: hypothetical protein CFH84_08295 [Sulfurimonas sp. UBA12504]
MISRFILFLILGVDALVLLLQTSEISISYDEARLLYGDTSFLQLFIKTSFYFFGQNDFGLRLPMIALHISSALLLYEISKKYLIDVWSRLWLVVVFVLLPGVISSAILFNSAGLVIFGLLVFVYIYENYATNVQYLFLLMLCLIDSDFAYLFLALFFYGLYTKDKVMVAISSVLFLSNIYYYGLDIYGMPSGYFLDIMGIYAAVFTPIVFIYIFYVLYRRYVTKDIDLLWFIATTAFIFSILLSFRQRVDIEHFAPYVILALPLAARTFINSYRVRLKVFRGSYRNIFTVSLIFLLCNALLVFFNKELYLFIENPNTHFAYKMHVAKEVATKLHEQKIDCIQTDKELALRLRFYGVHNCDSYILKEKELNDVSEENSVTISYRNKHIFNYCVTKINKL